MNKEDTTVYRSLDDTSRRRHVSIVGGQIDSRELFQTERELQIRHGDEIYRLRRTGLNKLILTK